MTYFVACSFAESFLCESYLLSNPLQTDIWNLFRIESSQQHVKCLEQIDLIGSAYWYFSFFYSLETIAWNYWAHFFCVCSSSSHLMHLHSANALYYLSMVACTIFVRIRTCPTTTVHQFNTQTQSGNRWRTICILSSIRLRIHNVCACCEYKISLFCTSNSNISFKIWVINRMNCQYKQFIT